MTKILITGAAGFIGHHFTEHILCNTDWEIVALDRLNYASKGWERLRDIDIYDDVRVHPMACDLADPISVGVRSEIERGGKPDYIVHMAAETHVDRSIDNARPFVRANVMGTLSILEYAQTLDKLTQYVYFSTDEIFGPAPDGILYQEWSRYDSGNPYAATKAAGEELSLAFANTHEIPTLITHSMNAFGERQHPEKFIPLVIRRVLNGEKVLIHSNADKTKAGSRFYVHARNISAALLFLLNRRIFVREKVNIRGEQEVNNLDLALFIADIIGEKLDYEMVDHHSSRPGHDLRYSLDGMRLEGMGFKFPKTFEESLVKTIEWTLKRPEWIGL